MIRNKRKRSSGRKAKAPSVCTIKYVLRFWSELNLTTTMFTALCAIHSRVRWKAGETSAVVVLDTLGEEMGIPDRTLRRWFAELRDSGLVEVTESNEWLHPCRYVNEYDLAPLCKRIDALARKANV